MGKQCENYYVAGTQCIQKIDQFHGCLVEFFTTKLREETTVHHGQCNNSKKTHFCRQRMGPDIGMLIAYQ